MKPVFITILMIVSAVAALMLPIHGSGRSINNIRELKGVVKDTYGEPLAGVVIKVVKVEGEVLSGSGKVEKKEEMLGYSTTDGNGQFSIKQDIVAKINAADGNTELVFSCMGYEERRITLGEQGFEELGNVVL